MAGYYRFSKSNNAVQAENDGRYPLTKAAQVIAREHKVPVAQARVFLEKKGTLEYHHTSCWYNCTDYYDTDLEEEEIAELKATEIPKKTNAKKSLGVCKVTYLVWGGTRKHPVASEVTVIAEVIQKTEKTLEIRPVEPNEKTFIKRSDCKGLLIEKV